MTKTFVSLLLAATALTGAAQAAQTRATKAPATAAPTPATAPSTTPAAPATTTAAPTPATQTAPAAAGASTYTPFTAPNPAVDVVATLTAAGQFTTLLKAIDAAGLTATLKQPANLTVFAPTDAAFAALPAGTVDDLLKPENRTKLQHILLYHVINAPVTTAATAGHAAADIATVAGPTLHVDGSSGALKIGGADVVQADVKATNGTVQVIDKVLMPAS
jgi:uncharacterized surface protein with fasciclin (FAS1) repeats